MKQNEKKRVGGQKQEIKKKSNRKKAKETRKQK